MSKKQKQKAHIDNWSLHFGGTIHVDHPELTRFVLHGDVQGHPNPDLPDGEYIYTSHIEVLDLVNKICETRNTRYTLGAPDIGNIKSDLIPVVGGIPR